MDSSPSQQSQTFVLLMFLGLITLFAAENILKETKLEGQSWVERSLWLLYKVKA